MTTYNTGDPLGTVKPENLYDNTENLDYLMMGTEHQYPDRLGVGRKSWAGIEAASAARITELDNIITSLDTASFTFSSADAGMAVTTDGQYFRVINNSSFVYYKNSNGSAVFLFQLAGKDLVDDVLSSQGKMGLAFSGYYKDMRDQGAEVVLVSDMSLRKILYLRHSDKSLVLYGEEVASKPQVDEVKAANIDTWIYNGSDSDSIILLADSVGRVIRKIKVSEQAEYLFGKKVGTGANSDSYTPPAFWPEFVDSRSYGQSLSISLATNPSQGVGIETTLTDTYMFNIGIVNYNKTLVAFSAVPNTTSQQYHETSLIHQLQYTDPANGRKYFAAASGVSGYSMAQLEPGTDPFTQFMASIDKAVEVSAAAGYQYGLPVLTFFQGEADAYLGSSYSYYREKQRLIQSTVNSKVKSVARVNSDMPMIIYQMASHGRYQGLGSPSTDIPLAQLDEAIENPLIQLCTPMYIFPYTDGVHLTNHGYRWLGLYRAKATSYWMNNGKPWKPLYPEDVFKVGSKTVVAHFNVPAKPLQFRTDIVPEHPSGAKGFELWQEDSAGNLSRLTISTVELLGDDKVKVIATNAFSGTVYLAYGWTPLNRGDSDGAGRYPSWNSGINSGVCGNLCDSDPSTTDLLDANGTAYQLKNYCTIFFKEAI